MAGVRETWVRSFTVTDPTTHEKGFTVYKVTYKAFPLSRPEETIEVIVWKRYNDFKKLHKALAALHYNLRRPEKFPEFAKAKIFGRFDENVIEERRKSALTLLEFASNVPVLAKSQLMQNFFKGGEEVLRKKPMEPPILRPSNVANLVDPRETNAREADPNPPEMTSTSEGSKLPPAAGDDPGEESSSVLGGVWLHRQEEGSQDEDDGDAEDYVYEGSDDERTTFSEDSLPTTPLPQLQDISVFDPLAGDDIPDGPQPPSLHTSSSWLFHAMDLCADLKGGDSPDQSEESSLANSSTDLSSTEGGLTLKLPRVPGSESPPREPSGEPAVLPISQDIGFSDSSTTQVPSRDQRSSMAQAYLRCIRAQEAADRDARLDVHSGIVDSREETPNPSPQHGESRERSVSGDSISKLVIRGEEDYLYKAAKAIGLALQNEANGFYQAAFDSYKAGVSILLNGVAGETNKTRREAVRKKTAQYLMRAEDVYNNYLSDMENSKRWESETLAVESDPSSEHLRGAIEELKKYKVLGVVDRVMLVLDMSSYQTFVIKVLNKCAVADDKVRSCIPSYCPYMVRLCRFIESDSSIYLVLEHASGGKLWEYVSSYLDQGVTKSPERSTSNGRHRTLGTRSQSPQSPRRTESREESPFDRHGTSSPNPQFLSEECPVGGHARVNGDTAGNDRMTGEEASLDVESVGFGVPIEESEARLKGADGSEVRTGGVGSQTEFRPSDMGTREGPAGSRLDGEAGESMLDGVETPQGYRMSEGGSSGVGNPSRDHHQPPSIDATKSQEGGRLEDTDLTWISSSPSGSEGSLQWESMPVAPVALPPPSAPQPGNGSGEFGMVDEGESLNDLIEQSASYHDNIGGQSMSREEAQGETDGPPTGQRFSLFSLDSMEENPNTVASPDDSAISGPPGIFPDGIDDKTSHHIPVSEGQDADPVIPDAQEAVREVDGRVRGDENDKNPSRNTEEVVSSQSAHTDVPYHQGGLGEREESMGDNVFSGSIHSQEGEVNSDVNSRDNLGQVEDLRNPQEDNSFPSPSRKRSSKWDEFFKLNESEEGNRISCNTGSENCNIRENNKSADQRNGFNVCVNPFEVDPKGSMANPGSAKTCVVVNTPGQPRRTSVEIMRDWPSSPIDSAPCLSEEPATNGGGNLISQSDSSYGVGKKKHVNVTDSDGNAAPAHTNNDGKMQSGGGNIGPTNNEDTAAESRTSNEPTSDATRGDNDQTPTREARLPSLSKLFSHLDDIRRSQGAVHLPESCIRIWAAEMAVALSSLHAYGIICRDMNPANILLAQGGHIRLTHFSHWKCIKPILSTFAVENSYVAPEIHSLQPVTPACDWWSYGALLFELLTGRSLHSCHPCGISTHTELSIPDHVSDEGRRLLKQLIQPVPHERLGAGRSGVEEIKAHPFFAGVNWSTLRG